MFCKNCGKSIPDDSKFCPYCGASLSDVSKNPTTNTNAISTNQPVANVVPVNDGKIHLGKFAYDAKEFLGLKKYNMYFKVVMIINYISVLVFIAATATIGILSSEKVSTPLNILLIFFAVYAICYAGLMISSIFILLKQKKFAHGLKFMLIAKIVLIVVMVAFSILAILDINNTLNKNVGIFISTLVFSGFCFFLSGLNGSVSQSCVISKKLFEKAQEIVDKK